MFTLRRLTTAFAVGFLAVLALACGGTTAKPKYLPLPGDICTVHTGAQAVAVAVDSETLLSIKDAADAGLQALIAGHLARRRAVLVPAGTRVRVTGAGGIGTVGVEVAEGPSAGFRGVVWDGSLIPTGEAASKLAAELADHAAREKVEREKQEKASRPVVVSQTPTPIPPAEVAPAPRPIGPALNLLPRTGRLTLAASPADLAEYEAVWWRSSPRGKEMVDVGRVVVLTAPVAAVVYDRTPLVAHVRIDAGPHAGRVLYCHPDCVPR